jgi:acetyl esterase/lipase
MSMDRVDPECRAPLEQLIAQMPPGGLNGVPVTERRAMVSAMEAQMAAAVPTPANVQTEDLKIPGPEGAPEIAVRVYRPTDAEGPLPGLYYIHGGGMVVGNLESGHADCLRFCSELGAVVVNVDYRLAPENPHPAPGEDCYAGLKWMADNADGLGINTDRVAIYGPSAGGGLAVATALRARDRGGPKVAYVMAIYPMLDSRSTTPSSHEITDLGVWDRAANVEAWESYLGGKEPDAYASPVHADDLAGYPPTYIDVGTQDLFRDEDIAFASKLLAAGVPVELHVHPGAYHGSELLAPTAGVSQRQLGRRLEALRAALHPRDGMSPHAIAHAFAQSVHQPDALAPLLHPEATWMLPPSMGGRVQSGREAIVAFRTHVFHEVLDASSVDARVDGVFVADQQFAVRVHITATTAGGAPYQNDHIYVVDLSDGLIGNAYEHLDAAHAVSQLDATTAANENGSVEKLAPNHIAVRTSIEIDAPHDVVWAVLTDFEKHARVVVDIPRARGRLPGRRAGHGEVPLDRLHPDVRARAEVLRGRRAGRLVRSAQRGSSDRHVFRVEPMLNGRSRLVQTDEPHGPAVRLFGGSIGRQSVTVYQAFNRALKAQAESVHQG